MKPFKVSRENNSGNAHHLKFLPDIYKINSYYEAVLIDFQTRSSSEANGIQQRYCSDAGGCSCWWWTPPGIDSNSRLLEEMHCSIPQEDNQWASSQFLHPGIHMFDIESTTSPLRNANNFFHLLLLITMTYKIPRLARKKIHGYTNWKRLRNASFCKMREPKQGKMFPLFVYSTSRMVVPKTQNCFSNQEIDI